MDRPPDEAEEEGPQGRPARARGRWEQGREFWLNVLMELKNREVKDVFVPFIDGLKGFPDAIKSLYLQTQV